MIIYVNAGFLSKHLLFFTCTVQRVKSRMNMKGLPVVRDTQSISTEQFVQLLADSQRRKFIQTMRDPSELNAPQTFSPVENDAG